eukprot:9488363-Alexandrium_andersonii.AAC.1
MKTRVSLNFPRGDILAGNVHAIGRDVYQATRIMTGLIDRKSGKVSNPTLYGRLKKASEDAAHAKELVADRIPHLQQAALLGHLK